MEDLWIFNFETNKWVEVQMNSQSTKPCARRFHSSVLINNELFIIGGCHTKYRPLTDIYSMDLSPFIKTQNIDLLEWKERTFNSSSILSRWGHTSSVFEGKIYVFGGRFSSDLNDIVVIDIEKETMKSLKTTSNAPKPRRRHSGCFMGSSLIIFGGFNG